MTLGYIIPNIYVFLRIRQLFIKKRNLPVYILIYLLIVSIYPLSNTIEDSQLQNALEKITGFLLPYCLYLFLSILLTDIVLLVNLLFKIVPFAKLKNPDFRKKTFVLVLVLPVMVVIYGIINFNTIRTVNYRIEIPGRASAGRKVTIAFLADFHLHDGIDIDFVRRYASKIKEINPDIVLYGGDIIEDRNAGQQITEYEKIMRDIKAPLGSFAVLGNHEHYSGNDSGSFHAKSGIILLRDTVVTPGNLFNLGGRNDRERKPLNGLLQMAKPELPFILIDHRPTDVIDVSRSPVDVQFSGHTHNGQLFPINLITKSMYEISHGHRKIGNTHFFVTSGIRLWGPPVRTISRSEIVVVNISFTRE
jgi:predicted MPP superfamily phosphohydrolase